MTGKLAAVPDKARARGGTADGYDILVLDAGYRQSLASARSLGRAGLRVALGECFAEATLRCPYWRSGPAIRPATWCCLATPTMRRPSLTRVVDFVREHPTRVVLPTMTALSRR